MHSYKTVSTQLIFSGKVVNLRIDEISLPDGRKASREVVEHPGGVAILAVNEKREVYFVKQHRQPIGDSLLEIPAGKLETGEAPELCAGRELIEEIGIKAKRLELISTYYSTPGFTSEKLYIYLATELEIVEQQIQDDEDIEIVIYPLSQAVEMARQGLFKDGKTLIALLLADHRLNI